MTKIKICGLTNSHDIENAANSGADYLGFIFVPDTPRYIKDFSSIKESIQKIPKSIKKVAVIDGSLGSPSPATLLDYNFDLIQIHGNMPFDVAVRINSPFFKVFRTSGVLSANDVVEIRKYSNISNLEAIMIDSFELGKLGGTGKTFNWGVIDQIRSITNKNIIVSGGLNPQNLQAAIDATHPYAVDMSSGVEAFIGKKDPAKVETVIKIAHAN